MIPFDEEISTIEPPRFCGGPRRDARRQQVVRRRELPLRQARRATPELLARRSEFDTRVVPLVEVRRRAVSSTRIRALVAAGDAEGAMRCLGAPFLLGGDRGRGRSARPHARLPDRERRADDEYVVPGPWRVRRLRRRPARRRERRCAPHVRDGARAACGGLPHRLRRRPLRPDAADRVHRPPARRAALRRAWRT